MLTTKKHNTKVKYLDYNEVFSHSLIKEIDDIYQESAKFLEVQVRLVEKIEELCNIVLKEVTKTLEETKIKAKQLFQEKISQENLKALKVAVETTNSTFFSKDLHSLTNQDFQRFIMLYQKRRIQLDKEIAGCESVMKSAMKGLELIDDDYSERIQKIKNILEVDAAELSTKPDIKPWCWDLNLKPEAITLTDDKLGAKANTTSRLLLPAVFGNTIFQKGKYCWDITTNLGGSQSSYIAFGIIKSAKANNHYNDLSDRLSDAFGIDSKGDQFCGPKQSLKNKGVSFKQTTFKCVLNFVEETFQISYLAEANKEVWIDIVKMLFRKLLMPSLLLIPFVVLGGENDEFYVTGMESYVCE